MKFSKHYSEQDQKRVLLLKDEIDTFCLGETDLNCGYGYSQIKTVLEGTSPIVPTKLVMALWEHVFPQTNLEAFEQGERHYSDKYTDEDMFLCNRIKMRLHSRELKEQEISASSIAMILKKSPATISLLLNGKYNAPPTKFLHQIWSVVCPTEILSNEPEPETETAPQKNIQIRYGQVPFINTNVANLIAMACMQAKDRRRFSVFAGGAGIGKTKAIEEYCKQNEFAILLNGSEQISGVQVLLQLCQKLGIPKSRNAPRNIENIIYTLRDSDRLIILDEADKCKPNALDPLRTISDHAMVGVTLVGNIQLVDKLRSQERYELIASRVCFWPKPMGQISVEDIQSLFIKLTQNSLTLSDNSDKWWVWLHKRVEGNARELVENLLPHLLKFDKKNKHKKIDRLFVNSIFANVLNKPAI